MTDPRLAALAEAIRLVAQDWEPDWPDARYAAAILAALPPDWCGHDTASLATHGWHAVESAEITRLRKIEEAARFRASVTFTNLNPQPEGPDLLDAIAAWMDGIDDREGRVGPTDRQVQADVRRWANALRAALREDTDA